MTPATPSANDADIDVVVLRLYVAGNGTNSILARRNLDVLCKANSDRNYELEVIDVEKNPDLALERGVFVTPSLEILEPAPGALIYGNLTDRASLEPFFPCPASHDG
jgi:circadian clock protein KaiB